VSSAGGRGRSTTSIPAELMTDNAAVDVLPRDPIAF